MILVKSVLKQAEEFFAIIFTCRRPSLDNYILAFDKDVPIPSMYARWHQDQLREYSTRERIIKSPSLLGSSRA